MTHERPALLLAKFIALVTAGVVLGSLAIYAGFFMRDPEYLAQLDAPLVDSGGNATYWLVIVGCIGVGLVAWSLWHAIGLFLFNARLRR